jgi:transposase
MTRNTYLPKDYDTFIGIDVDKNSFAFTVKDHGAMSRAKKIPANPENLYNYIRKHFAYERVLCAYEAGPTGFHLHDYLTQQGQPCFIVSPLSIPKAKNEKIKNNRIDSEKLSKYLRTGELKAIRVPYGPYRELRHLINMRENYVHNRKAAKQRIKALLLSDYLYPGLKDIEQNWSNNYIQQLKKLSCTPAARERLNMLLMDLDYARKQTLSILKQLRIFNKEFPEIKRNTEYLQSIPGIGFITAITVLGRIGNPQNLKNVREIAAFAGIVPTEKSTGDTINQGSITHLGNRNLRCLLVEAAWVAIRKDRELNQFYHRIKARHHPKIAARKAIVAVARKLTQRIYKILKEQRTYITH